MPSGVGTKNLAALHFLCVNPDPKSQQRWKGRQCQLTAPLLNHSEAVHQSVRKSSLLP